MNAVFRLFDIVPLIAQITLLLIAGGFAFQCLRQYLFLQGKGMPHGLKRLSPFEVGALPPRMVTYDEMLREHGFKLIGMEMVKLFSTSKEMPNYIYLSQQRDTYAEIHFPVPDKALIGLVSRFADNSVVLTTFPVGESIRKPNLVVSFAANNPQAIFSHHAAIVAAATKTKGTPVIMRNWLDVQACDEVYRLTHRKSVMHNTKQVKLVASVWYLFFFVIIAFETARLLMNMEPGVLSMLNYAVLAGVFVELVLTGARQKPSEAIDWGKTPASPVPQPVYDKTIHPLDQPAPQPQVARAQPQRPVTIWRLAWLAPLLLALAFPALLVVNPGLFGNINDIRYHSGDEWVTIASPGRHLRSFSATPDGALWGLTESTVVRWDGSAWQTIFTISSLALEFAVDHTRIWVVSKDHIIYCDAEAVTCSIALEFPGGADIAANRGRVLVLNEEGVASLYDGESWSQFALAEHLPQFDAEQVSWVYAETAITADRTLWIEWNYIWHLPPDDDQWILAYYGQDDPVRADILGSANRNLWTEWSNGISRDQPDLSDWDFYYWEDVGRDLSDEIFEVETGPDGEAWLATMDGVLHHTGDKWDLIPVPGAMTVAEIAITPDNRLWVQVASQSSGLLLIVVGVGILLLMMYGMRRLVA